MFFSWLSGTVLIIDLIKLINLIIDLSILFEIFQSYIENARSNNKKSNNLETCSQNFTVDFGRGIMSIIVFWLW